MGTLNLGRVRGTMWYSGTAITGTSTTGTIFSGSGITAAYTGDMYLNTSTGSDAGNVYTCTVAGDASTAKWAYTGALKVQTDIINNLNSTETNKALAANQGRVLKELIEGSGILPLSVLPKVSAKAYTANITVKNASGTITVITDDGEEGTYTVTASGSASTITAIFTIGSDIGLSATGAVIQEIRSTQPIYEYHLFNNSSSEIAGGIPDLWTRLNEAEENVRTGSNITDGSETVKGGILSKIVDGVRSVLWPITHAKAVWFDKANNKTVHDVIGTETMGTSATTLTGAIAEHESDISTLNSNKLSLMGDLGAAISFPYTCQTDMYGYAELVPSSSTNVYWYPTIGEKTLHLFARDGVPADTFFVAKAGTVIQEGPWSGANVTRHRIYMGRL